VREKGGGRREEGEVPSSVLHLDGV